MTFDELAKWCNAYIDKMDFLNGVSVRCFEIHNKRVGTFLFCEDGEVWHNGVLFVDRTPEQMKQIIIAGGLKE